MDPYEPVHPYDDADPRDDADEAEPGYDAYYDSYDPYDRRDSRSDGYDGLVDDGVEDGGFADGGRSDSYDRFDDDRFGGRDDRPRPRRRALPKLLVTLVVLAAVLGGGIYAAGSLLPHLGGGGSSEAKDYPGPGTTAVGIRVEEGDSLSDIADTLYRGGVIASRKAFLNTAGVSQDAERIQPGEYPMKRQMSAAQALAILLDPSANTLRLTITEGETVQAVLKALSAHLRVPVATYEAIVRDPAGKLRLPAYANGLVEGYFYPATYVLDPAATPAQTLQMFVDEFTDQTAALGLESGAARLGLTPAQVVIVASILEKEVKNAPEYPMAATVIYNRLHDQREFPTLGMDSTTRYAENNYEGPLTQSQLAANNPYNTRKISGLPPGAISNPGHLALTSALNPTPGSWKYFVSMPNGETKFATTPQEFDQLLAEYKAAGGTVGG